jgi:hypothetical protein
VQKKNGSVLIHYRKQKILLPKQDVILLPLANTSTELLAEYIARQLQIRVRQQFPGTDIRYIEVGVEEARSQRAIFRGEF